MERRSFLCSAVLATTSLVSTRLFAATDLTARGRHIQAGGDRYGNPVRLNGITPTDTKVGSSDSGGNLYLFEHRNMPRGGPPRHYHLAQDEWFYVVAGEFVFEVADERFRLQQGDTIFLPRLVPHAWASLDTAGGTILGCVTPAGTFEEFFREVGRLTEVPAPAEAERLFAYHGMKIVGPPLPLDQ